jgi:hypothetical protein
MLFGLRRVAATVVAIALTASGPASAQLFWKTPDFRGAPVQGGEPGVMIALPGATPAELNAEIVWTMRAGLNFAALQCQFAPSLMTVDTYNQLITHHSKELAADYKVLQGYFKRTAAKGTSASAIAAAFDSYNTRTYSSFSSVFAQVGFCQTASRIGQAALMTPKGSLQTVARNRLRELRNSLVPTSDLVNTPSSQPQFAESDVPALPPSCFDRKGEIKKKCL